MLANTDLPATSGVERHLSRLVESAILAPSGDNTQPWSFELEPSARRIRGSVNPSRDPSPMNLEQCMARVALGAALENILVTARANQVACEWEIGEDGTFSLVADIAHDADDELAIPEVIRQRTVNRRVFDGQAATPSELQAIAALPVNSDRVGVEWVSETERLANLGKCLSTSDRILFGDRTFRRAFLDNVRFDAADEEAVEHGLSLASLELKGLDRLAFKLLPKLPDGLVDLAGVSKKFSDNARRAVKSSSGLCIGYASGFGPSVDVEIGQVMQRCWLGLTELGFAVQPMMSPAIFQNVMEFAPTVADQLGREDLQALLSEIRQEVGAAQERCGFVLRFGHAQAPSGRCGRMPMSKVITSND